MAHRALRVLLVEDDMSFGRALSKGLRSAGHTVEAVVDGRHAIERLENNLVPDVIISDWLLPNGDGMAVLQCARSLPNPPRVIIFTAIADPHARAHALREGADAFLSKPAPMTMVLAALDALPSATKECATDVPAAVRRITGTPFWAEFAELSNTVLSDCTGQVFRDMRARDPSDEEMRASLTMFDVARSLSFQLSIGCSVADGVLLGRSMLRIENADRDMIWDMLSELCNNVLGRAKSALGSLGYSFTLSVPSKGESPRLPSVASKIITIGSPLLRLRLDAELRTTTTTTVRLSALAENMVLIDDLRTESGALLVPAATRLTAATIERIIRRLPTGVIRVVS